MRNAFLIAAVALSTPAPAAEPACTGALPAALAVPAGQALAFELSAEGVQVYRCAAAASGFAWSFVAPEATLRDGSGAGAGRHFAGPTWEAGDGSQVVAVRAEGATPDPAAIPWLLLRASAHAGAGRMAPVTWVQRVATSGGNAPAGGCDAGHAGEAARVPYRAAYCFYRAAGPQGAKAADPAGNQAAAGR